MPKPVTFIKDLTRLQMIAALERVQHFCPPRPTRQDKATLQQAIWAALNSDRYCRTMAAALRDNGLNAERADGLCPAPGILSRRQQDAALKAAAA